MTKTHDYFARRIRSSEIVALTSIRGIAAIWVVIFHMHFFFPRIGIHSKSNFVELGYIAVDLFFVLSGFVLTLTQNYDFSIKYIHELYSFFLARSLRLYPLHWFVLILFITLVAISPEQRLGYHPYTWEGLITTALLIQVWIGDHSYAWNSPAWSIAAEVTAYALFPLLFEAARRIATPGSAGALVIFMITTLAVMFIATGSTTLDHTWHLGMVRCILEFSAGVYLCRYAALIGRDRIKGDIALLLGLAIIILVIAFPVVQLAAPLGFAVLILACYASVGVAPRLLGYPIIWFLGRISFSIYLVHMIVLIVADGLAAHLQIGTASLAIRWSWIIMQMVVILLFATATWRWIERPGQRLSHRIRQHLTRQRSTAATIAGGS